MKKLLYIMPTSFDFSALSGVQKKVLNQSNAFVSMGYDVDVLSYYDGYVCLYHIEKKSQEIVKKGNSRTAVLKAVPRVINGYDYVYIRYPMSDYFFIRALKAINEAGLPTVLEIPTYPYESEGKTTIRGRLALELDRCFRRWIYKYVDRICTYSADKIIYDIPTINTINGYDFSMVNPDESIVDTHDSINLIAVSSMWPLHGYDRLIKGLGDYYSAGGDRNILLHIVGSGYVEQDYKALTTALELKDHVVFHGKVFGEDLARLYKGQAMGVNSLAIHRDSLTNESTLKTKEYAALGLPIISSSYVDAFSEEGNKLFTLRIPADESNVDVVGMISYLDALYSTPIKELRDSIRNDAKAVCDMAVTLKPIVDYFESYDRDE